MILSPVVNRFWSIVDRICKATKLLVSRHFYKNFFSGLDMIWQLIRHGSFLMTTKIPDKSGNDKLIINSRFQADGDITIMLPAKSQDWDLEKLCRSHMKTLKHKIDTIWFVPKFIMLIATTITSILIFKNQLFDLFEQIMIKF